MSFLKGLSRDVSQTVDDLVSQEFIRDEHDKNVNTSDTDEQVNTLDEESDEEVNTLDEESDEEVNTLDEEVNTLNEKPDEEVNTLDEESDKEVKTAAKEKNDRKTNTLDENAQSDISSNNQDDVSVNEEESHNEDDGLSQLIYEYAKELDNKDSKNKEDVLEEKEKQMAQESKKDEIDEILTSLGNIEKGIDEEAFERTIDDDMAIHSPTYFDIDDGQPASEECTVITKGTTVGGGINASGSLEIYGSVNGDVECRGKLTILGDVTGSAKASEIYINTSRFEGDITSRGPVKIGVGTVVIGDVTGTSATISGAIKGEVDVAGPVLLDSTAVIKGNVKAKSVQINNGAVLQGFCSLEYSNVDIDDFFEAEEFR